MTAHAIERTLAEAAQPAARNPVGRRLWVDAPYSSAKAALVAAVADSNHCHCILTSKLTS
jgi:hypothetical protein